MFLSLILVKKCYIVVKALTPFKTTLRSTKIKDTLIQPGNPFVSHLRVRIERVTSTAALSQHLQQQVLSQQDRGGIELETLTSQGQTGDVIKRQIEYRDETGIIFKHAHMV